jgi:hypothetical protein
MAEPDVAVHETIAAASISGLTKATRTEPPFNGNLILGPPLGEESNSPGLSVFVLDTGGPLDAPFIGGGKSHRIHAVQVYVRGPRNQYAATMTLAKAVRAALHYATPTGYYACTCRESAPIYIGRDDYERHGFSINVELRRVV